MKFFAASNANHSHSVTTQCSMHGDTLHLVACMEAATARVSCYALPHPYRNCPFSHLTYFILGAR